MISGLLLSHCTSAVSEVILAAGPAVADNTDFVIPTLFGVLTPGKETPFVVAVPQSVVLTSAPVLHVSSFTARSGPVPLLQIHQTAMVSDGANLDIQYSIKNVGLAGAVLPRVAARLNGASCSDPFVVAFAGFGNALAPGQTVAGSVSVPAGCTGAPQLFAGADLSPDEPLAPGLTLRDGATAYDAAGNLHVFGTLCNGETLDFLFPLLHVRLNSPSGPKNVDIYNTGLYPAGACGPFATTFANAPAGLTFGALTSYEGEQVSVEALGIEHETAEETFSKFYNHPTSDPHLFGRGNAAPLAPQLDGGTPTFNALVYNPLADAVTSASFRAVGVARASDGSDVGVLDAPALPTIPSHSWAVLSLLRAMALCSFPGHLPLTSWFPATCSQHRKSNAGQRYQAIVSASASANH